MCTHDLARSRVTETRRANGRVYRRRKCECGAPSFITEERRCEGMPLTVNAVSTARVRAYRERLA